jgi:tRNA G46 methylase TrmB
VETGYFPVRIAKRVPKGMVFACDVEQNMVNYLKKRVEDEKIPNIQVFKADADSPNLPQPG